jgi:pyruvate formate lyase activating enzyme
MTPELDSSFEAMHYEKLGEDRVHCHLCAHDCRIMPGKRGICGVRENRGGTLYSLIRNRMSSVQVDPIEKKPLYHFHPSTQVLSFGSIGCNFACAHCQNYSISQAESGQMPLRRFDASAIPALARKEGCEGVAWTYNEPTVWYETTLEGSRVCIREGLYTCYVTNGYIQEAPLREIAPYMQAMNIDVKAFTDAFYKEVCKARLKPVLDTCVLAHELGIHIELTYLVIPGLNDRDTEFREFATWVKDKLGKGVPVHFSRFHPDFRMLDRPPTPRETLARALHAAREVGLEHVYVGNIHQPDDEQTRCPSCKSALIDRAGFSSRILYTGGKCPGCGKDVPIVM